MNEISIECGVGTIGELLVTLRLLQYGVQAATPLKDSGNDLIAVRRGSFRAIQVKTIRGDRFNNLKDLPEFYHIVALVHLVQEGKVFNLEESKIFFLRNNQVLQEAMQLII